MSKSRAFGHILALITIIIWGTTFISTKVLLTAFKPVEILFFRFVMGYAALLAACPHRLEKVSAKREVSFAAAGICGVTIYYLMENISLTYTMASNASVIVSIAPFFTGLLAAVFLKEEGKLKSGFFIGFVVAIAGIALISFNGAQLHFSPIGDLLALMAAVSWAVYSILIKRIGEYGYKTILITRRIFFYGILFMIPPLFFLDFELDLMRFSQPVYLFNTLFLGLGASAMCFVTWNYAVKLLGAMKTSLYIYMVPVITVITSSIILKEPITVLSAIGTALILVGLFVSEKPMPIKRKN